MMKTYVPKQGEIRHDWYVIDAADVVLGRLSTKVATLLRGKHKPELHAGARHRRLRDRRQRGTVKMTGNKWEDKKYYRHSGDPGHLTEQTARELRDKSPGAPRALRRLGHAAEEPAGPPAPPEAQGLRRR